MKTVESISLPANTRILAELRKFIGGIAAIAGVDGRSLHALELAADEIATNVIDHVPNDIACDIFCKFEINSESKEALCTISWQSNEPFRPTILPETDHIRQRIESRQPGGLGIYLIHSLVDEIEYDYHDGRSVIIMRKKI